jgi:predicted methyltransferase
MSRTSIALFAALLATAALSTSAAAPAVPDYVTAAVNDPGRPAADVAQDPLYKPAELFAFSKIKPGDKVFEFFAAGVGGYHLRILSKLVGPKGHVYAAVAQEMVDQRPTAADLVRTIAANPEYSNVTVLVEPARSPSAPEPLDAFVIFSVYHDMHTPAPFGTGELAPFNRAVFAALKPGGTYFVTDFAAPKGSGFTVTPQVHRVEPDAEKAEIMQAGFVFDGASDVLAKPDDDYSAHSKAGSDQFTFRFHRPT